MYTLLQIGTRSGSCVRKASDPIPVTVTAGRVAGLHLVFAHTTKFYPVPCDAVLVGSHIKGWKIMRLQTGDKQMSIRVAIIAAITTAMVACGGGKSESSVAAAPSPAAKAVPSESSKLCAFANDDEAANCHSGQVSIYLPNSWGNEQLPIIYAAKYCDFNFPIVHTNGAVSCVFFKGRTLNKTDGSTAPQTPSSGSTNQN